MCLVSLHDYLADACAFVRGGDGVGGVCVCVGKHA